MESCMEMLADLSIVVADKLEAMNRTSMDDILKQFENALQIYNETGSTNGLQELQDHLINLNSNFKSQESTTFDETQETPKGKRPQRKAFVKASTKVSKQLKQPLNSKLRRGSGEENIDILNIKKEVEMPPPVAVPVKPRGRPPGKVKTEPQETTRISRSTRIVEGNEEVVMDNDTSSSRGQNSDVQIVQESLDVIVLDRESELDTDGAIQDASTGSSLNQSAAKPKRTRSPSSERKKKTKPQRSKRTKRKAVATSPVAVAIQEKDKDVDNSVYEDAIGGGEQQVEAPTKISFGDREIVVHQPIVMLARLSKDATGGRGGGALNETVTISKAAIPAADATMLLDKPKVLLNSTEIVGRGAPAVLTMEDIMTDDESIDEIPKCKPTAKVVHAGSGKHGTCSKQVFNPFENSPLKKKVEAFEKLGQVPSAMTATRSTRTKTRQVKKDKQADEDGTNVSSAAPVVSEVKKPAPVYTTPTMANRYIPSVVRSGGNKPTASSGSVAKAKSALQASQQQCLEREQRRKEKEAEALRKREAQLLKTSEEKRQRREEREQRARAQREQLEREKQEMLALQKAKDERQRQLQLAEREERMQRQREEAERRRLLAKQRCEEARAAKQREKEHLAEEQRMHEQRLREAKLAEARAAAAVEPPIYMRVKEPPLPTPDCYDSDDEKAPKRVELPAWNRSAAMENRFRLQPGLSTALINTLFCTTAQTPDLAEIFPNVDPRKLRRNSSAIWNSAPRFTMLPALDEDF